MHACELVDLAALVAMHGPALVRQPAPSPENGIEQYWTASKCRLDRWGRALKGLLTARAEVETRSACSGSAQVRGLVEEILTSEILTRVWTAVLCACDRRHGTDAAEPVARSVMIGHLEARHRVLTLLVSGPGIHVEEAVKLNRLRRRTECWADLLIGHLADLAHLAELSEFAIEPQRASDFADDFRRQNRQKGAPAVWPLARASLKAAFAPGLVPVSPNADLNAAVAAGVLACFPPEVFDGAGLVRSLWLARLATVTNDAQGMIEALLGPDATCSAVRVTDASGWRRPGRLRRFER